MIDIGGFKINNNSKCFIIAELSANHGGDIEIAKETIKMAKKSGADAIKLQTYTADTLTIDCNNEYFKIDKGTIWDGKTLHDLYNEAYTPWEWQKELKDYAESIGLMCFSSPFDKSSVDFLEELNVPAYKVASFEILDIELIEYIASKGKPIIISTGIAKEDEIRDALEACKRVGNNNVILLKCTSEYPAKIEDANIITIPDMMKKFGVIIGLSDHTMGNEVALGAVALGAKVVEKHFVLNRKINGPDASFSMTPDEFEKMVKSIRKIEAAMGNVSYNSASEKSRVFARSLFIVKDVKKGDTITRDNIRCIRPGYGIAPKYLNDVLGKTFNDDYQRGTPLNWEQINQ